MGDSVTDFIAGVEAADEHRDIDDDFAYLHEISEIIINDDFAYLHEIMESLLHL